MNKEEGVFEAFKKSFSEQMKKRREEYKKKAEEYINKLDLRRLEEIKGKKLVEITQEDLEFIGFCRQQEKGFKEFYYFQDFNGIKIYFNREGGKFEKRGYMLRKEKDILTTKELLENSLTDWKLRMNDEGQKLKSGWNERPPF